MHKGDLVYTVGLTLHKGDLVYTVGLTLHKGDLVYIHCGVNLA